MTDLLAARSQMAMSLAFHIVFAAIGIAMFKRQQYTSRISFNDPS
jgi:hypothetical protein